MNYTPEQLRQIADAMQAHQLGKAVECKFPDDPKWTDAIPIWSLDEGCLYRPKPEPKVRAWSKRDDVPLNCWLRPKHAGVFCGAVVGFYATGLRFISSTVEEVDYSKIHHFEHSTDRKTWHPCVVEEEPK